MFWRKKTRVIRFTLNEFTIFGVFVAVAMFGLLYGIVLASMNGVRVSSDAIPLPTPVVAPTPEEYQKDARDVLTPFIEQAQKTRKEDLSGDNAAMLQLVEKTQDRLLRVRVPAEYRDAHLSFVLLLDQWKRALRGSAPDQNAVLGKTLKLIAENPWLGPQ